MRATTHEGLYTAQRLIDAVERGGISALASLIPRTPSLPLTARASASNGSEDAPARRQAPALNRSFTLSQAASTHVAVLPDDLAIGVRLYQGAEPYACLGAWLRGMSRFFPDPACASPHLGSRHRRILAVQQVARYRDVGHVRSSALVSMHQPPISRWKQHYRSRSFLVGQGSKSGR